MLDSPARPLTLTIQHVMLLNKPADDTAVMPRGAEVWHDKRQCTDAMHWQRSVVRTDETLRRHGSNLADPSARRHRARARTHQNTCTANNHIRSSEKTPIV